MHFLLSLLVAFTWSLPSVAVPATPAACASMTFDQVVDASGGGLVASSSGARYLIFAGHGATVSIPTSGPSCIVAVDGSQMFWAASVLSHSDVCVRNGNTKLFVMNCETVAP